MPREQPTWPAASPPLLLFPRHSCCRAHRGARRRSAARWLPPRRCWCRLALKYPLAHPEAAARSFSSPPHLVIVGAKTRRHCRRHGRRLPRPLSSSTPAFMSVGVAANALVAALKELGREPLHRAQPRRSSFLLRRSSPPNSSPSRRPRASHLNGYPPGESLFRGQPPLPSSLHRSSPHHGRRSSPPPSCSPPWPGHAFGTPAMSPSLHTPPVSERAHARFKPHTKTSPPSPPEAPSASARRRRSFRPSPATPPPPFDARLHPESNGAGRCLLRRQNAAPARRRRLLTSPAITVDVAPTWR